MRFTILFAALTAVSACGPKEDSSTTSSYRTTHFTVTGGGDAFDRQVGEAAEEYRKKLAIDWLGEELKSWDEVVPITLTKVGEGVGSGGATSFIFNAGQVYGWKMDIQGNQARLLDSVLNHEILHTVFASHFRRPIPRWADEGACSTIEHGSERAKYDTILIDALRTKRGIAFDKMFFMTEYPSDVLPLYAQGHSLATLLTLQKDKKEYVRFLEIGMETENWVKALNEVYGYKHLLDLQERWMNYVKGGSSPFLTASMLPENPNTIAQGD